MTDGIKYLVQKLQLEVRGAEKANTVPWIYYSTRMRAWWHSEERKAWRSTCILHHFALTYHRKPLRSNFQGCTEKTTFWHELRTCLTHLTQDMRELVPSAPLHRLNLNSPKPNTTHVLSAPKHDTRTGAQFEWNMHAPNGSLSEINASIFYHF